MKNRLSLLTLCLGLVLSGCGGTASTASSQQAASSKATTNEIETYEARTHPAVAGGAGSTDEIRMATYESETYSFSYNSATLIFSDVEGGGTLYAGIDTEDEQNSMMLCVEEDNPSYDNVAKDGYAEFYQTFCSALCSDLFALGEDVTISAESCSTDTGYEAEYSDGTKCYIKILHFGPEIAYAGCRLCEYSEEANSDLYSAYLSASGTKDDEFLK